MNKKILTFLDDVCIHIRCKKVHMDIRDELTNHIFELKDDYINNGYEEEKALDMAISAMGNCNEIGECLNKQHKPETEWSLIGLAAIIAIIGGIVMFTSSKFQSIYNVNFDKYLTFAVIGIGIMIGFYFFDYTKLKKLAFPAYSISLLLLFFSCYQDVSLNGRRFLTIFGVSISSEFVMILFLVAIVGFIEKSRGKGNKAFIGILILAFVSVLPILAQPNLSIAIILMTCYAVSIIAAVIKNHFGGTRKVQFICLGSIGGLIISIISCYIITKPERVLCFLTRGRLDHSGAGWQQVMADNWLSVSKLFGKTNETLHGLSLDKGMPAITTDYVLINIIATLGWVVGIALVVVIAIFIGRMFVTTKKIKNDYGFYLSLGASSILSVQFTLNVLMNFSFFPLMGVSMPFVSYGGVGYIVSMALVGIILSVWRRNNLVGASTKTIVQNSSKHY